MDIRSVCKAAVFSASFFTLVFASGCTQNPLTGRQEFTGLMSSQQEQAIGAEQHQSIIKEYGGVYDSPGIQAYVNEIGQKLAQQSDRKDVTYRFTVLDSPVVNAFALPGGYVYVTRGTLALANSEAELAAVLGHEIGHVAGRHQASRYSRGILTQLGATVLSSAIGIPAASQAIGIGSNLYMSSYSRGQETEADKFGVRYLSRTGYDLNGMSDFLKTMSQYHSVQAQVDGKQEQQYSYFSSHPDTVGRVVEARADAQSYKNKNGVQNRERYISMVRGMTYGDEGKQGFVRDGTFYHPDLGFAFSVPRGFKVDNQPERVAIEGQDGTVFVLDMADSNGSSIKSYVSDAWLKGQLAQPVDSIDINGMIAATTAVGVAINNQPAEIRLVGVEWDRGQVVRMQILIPRGASTAVIDDMKRMSYSFHRMTGQERNKAKPYRIDLVKAGAGDTIQSLASRMAVDKMAVEQFAALNGMTPAEPLVTGHMYKIIR